MVNKEDVETSIKSNNYFFSIEIQSFINQLFSLNLFTKYRIGLHWI